MGNLQIGNGDGKMDRKELEKVSDFLLGEENVAYAPYFIGKSYLSLRNQTLAWCCSR